MYSPVVPDDGIPAPRKPRASGAGNQPIHRYDTRVNTCTVTDGVLSFGSPLTEKENPLLINQSPLDLTTVLPIESIVSDQTMYTTNTGPILKQSPLDLTTVVPVESIVSDQTTYTTNTDQKWFGKL